VGEQSLLVAEKSSHAPAVTTEGPRNPATKPPTTAVFFSRAHAPKALDLACPFSM
jgi:hypothetical protein